jgi:hypothetical protein
MKKLFSKSEFHVGDCSIQGRHFDPLCYSNFNKNQKMIDNLKGGREGPPMVSNETNVCKDWLQSKSFYLATIRHIFYERSKDHII